MADTPPKDEAPETRQVDGEQQNGGPAASVKLDDDDLALLASVEQQSRTDILRSQAITAPKKAKKKKKKKKKEKESESGEDADVVFDHKQITDEERELLEMLG
ncbi:uncharacterized protein AMSG_03171 [Thecamonas trahens ATCC 50062]|uniref:Uncharacterized protein n=1 Tax=Thecamonas trahens ATCC 50062 TaxID=461836 RepID=A0A0L0D321_THETB|nr:hypothetical protein AMSG_03171 [Thecamonas trahens ATCC 50062]KNC46742.1 hypothetical protein AMSG_03171 [Thecamonas trahens ATCC 50062]|eukprot:XP_013760022.1 hypothetical protein AMSG_03171 [Thecamonas trahens ATCC 50062]